MKLYFLQQFINGLYHLFTFFVKTDPDKITFCTNRSPKLVGNLQKIYEITEKENEFKTKTVSFQYTRSFTGRLVYFGQSLRAIYHLSTSRVFIIDDYFFPIYCIKNKRNENQVVQVWHAIGHLKKYGLSISKNRQSPIKHHSNYDWVLSNAQEDCAAISEAFDIPLERIIVTGAPRLDTIVLSSPEVKTDSIFRVLYAPTYRNAKEDDPAYEYINAFLTTFCEKFKDENIQLYVSLHPYFKLDKIIQTTCSKVNVFQDAMKSSALLSSVDCLVTDYSSLLLDYTFFEKPIKIYAPDFSEYIENTGFYVDYQEYLGLPIYQETLDLMKGLMVYSLEERKNVLRLKQENYPYTDGKNSQRAYSFIKKIMLEK